MNAPSNGPFKWTCISFRQDDRWSLFLSQRRCPSLDFSLDFFKSLWRTVQAILDSKLTFCVSSATEMFTQRIPGLRLPSYQTHTRLTGPESSSVESVQSDLHSLPSFPDTIGMWHQGTLTLVFLSVALIYLQMSSCCSNVWTTISTKWAMNWREKYHHSRVS